MSGAQEPAASLATLSSFVAGLLGAGGDILVVPLLLDGLPALVAEPLDVHAVAALSLAGSLVATGGAGLLTARRDVLSSA